MLRELTNRVGRTRREGWLALALALASPPLAALDERGVTGGSDAASRARQARVESQMEAYGAAVGAELERRLRAELERVMQPYSRQAALGSRKRG